MKARFFCANCQAEVSPKTERCPKCGRFFSAVTCPVCGLQADADLFLKGCPVCGYMALGGKKKRARRKPERPARTFSPRFYFRAAVGLAAALAVLILLVLIRAR
jgi:predicted amidophosphoribosyltransferase